MELAKKTITGLAWMTLDKWAGRIISAGVLAVLARLLKPEDFGLVALASSFSALAEVFANQGLGFAIMMRPTVTHKDLNAVFWANLFCFGVAALVLVTISLVMIFGKSGKSDLGFILLGLAGTLIIQPLGRIQGSILTREMRFKSMALRETLAVCAGGIVGIAMAYRGAGAMSIVGQQLANTAVGALVLWRVSDWRPTMQFSWENFREVYSHGYKIFIDRIILYVRDNVDIFLISSVAGLTALGYYSVAKRIIEIVVSLFVASLTTVIYPAFSKMQDDLPRLLAGLYRAIRLTALIIVPLFFGILLMAPEAIHIVAGPNWDVAIPFVRILALSFAVSWMDPFVSGVLHARQHSGSVALIHGLGAITSVIAVLIGGQWGITGIIVAVSVRRVLGTFTQLKFTQKIIPELSILELSKGIWVPLCSSVLMVVGAWWCLNFVQLPLHRVLLGPAAGAILYAMALWLVGRISGVNTFAEISELIATFRKKKNGVVAA